MHALCSVGPFDNEGLFFCIPRATGVEWNCVWLCAREGGAQHNRHEPCRHCPCFTSSASAVCLATLLVENQMGVYHTCVVCVCAVQAVMVAWAEVMVRGMGRDVLEPTSPTAVYPEACPQQDTTDLQASSGGSSSGSSGRSRGSRAGSRFVDVVEQRASEEGSQSQSRLPLAWAAVEKALGIGLSGAAMARPVSAALPSPSTGGMAASGQAAMSPLPPVLTPPAGLGGPRSDAPQLLDNSVGSELSQQPSWLLLEPTAAAQPDVPLDMPDGAAAEGLQASPTLLPNSSTATLVPTSASSSSSAGPTETRTRGQGSQLLQDGVRVERSSVETSLQASLDSLLARVRYETGGTLEISSRYKHFGR